MGRQEMRAFLRTNIRPSFCTWCLLCLSASGRQRGWGAGGRRGSHRNPYCRRNDLGPSPGTRRDSSQVLSDAPSFTWREKWRGGGGGSVRRSQHSAAPRQAPGAQTIASELTVNLQHKACWERFLVAWSGRLYNLKRREMVPF